MLGDIIDSHNQYLEKVLVKLPTFIQTQLNTEKSAIDNAAYTVSKLVNKKLQKQYIAQERLFRKTSVALQIFQNKQFQILDKLSFSTKSQIALQMKHQQSQLKYYENTASLVNPEHILKRGFSITLLNNKPLVDVDSIQENDIIETHLYKGILISKVSKKRNK